MAALIPSRAALVSVLRRSFGTPLRAVVSLASLVLLAAVLPGLFRWAVLDAVWAGDAAACRAGGGACWAFIGAKLRFILFGLYPPGQSWRPALVLALLAVMIGISLWPAAWSRSLLPAWIVGLGVCLWLMAGGAGLTPVPVARWGGLPLTVLLTVIGLGLGFPAGIMLALARRSALWALRLPATGFIEGVRAAPLIVVLYFASIAVPLLLPEQVSVDKLFLAQLGLAAFASAYFAEVVRGGLQAVSSDQSEAAGALGLRHAQAVRLVILPQAVRHVVPALASTAIGFFQDTSLVAIIGVFDLLATARTASLDPEWLGHYDEAYLFAGLIYFGLSALASRYAAWIEARFRLADPSRGRRRSAPALSALALERA